VSRADNVVAFTDTIGPLALAPLAGVAVLTYTTLRDAAGNWMIAPYLALRIAPFCYGFTVLLVLPILAIRPALRRPSYLIGAIWGILSAWTAVVLFAWAVGQLFRSRFPGKAC
jgi:hypothetical protein